MLPYVSGQELISIMRESTEWRYVPILVVSGRVLEQDVVQAFELGVNDYVTKPFRPAELLVRLKRLIETRESLLFQTQSQST
jgi:DNA-binding response OmpR family regulator